MKPEHHRVVITGLGPVTAVGTGKEAFWDSLLKGIMNVREIPPDFESGYHFKSRFYVPFPETDIGKYGFPGKYACLMEESTRAAVIASKLALEDAGIGWPESGAILPVPPEECIIILGTGICPIKAGFDVFAAHVLAAGTTQSGQPFAPGRFNRMVIPMIMPDAAASWISILAGIKGPNFTLNASCASGTYAIGEAFLKVRNGEAGMALAGGVECLKDAYGIIMRGFDGLGTLTTCKDGIPGPFSMERSGFLFAEGGACILVLETLESANARGAVPYAEILGFGCNSDAHNIVQMDESGRQVRALLENLTGGRKIDYFNSHGTATLLNDEIEAKVIRSLFGDKKDQPLVNSTKGTAGHSIGVSGAIEAAATALSVKHSMVHMTLLRDPMENLNLATESSSCDIRFAISASYGFGGHNAALLFGKYEQNG